MNSEIFNHDLSKIGNFICDYFGFERIEFFSPNMLLFKILSKIFDNVLECSYFTQKHHFTKNEIVFSETSKLYAHERFRIAINLKNCKSDVFTFSECSLPFDNDDIRCGLQCGQSRILPPRSSNALPHLQASITFILHGFESPCHSRRKQDRFEEKSSRIIYR